MELNQTHHSVQLDVINSGDAIPTDKAGKLFDRFFRVDDSRNSKVEGKGLGLSLAREFVKAHNGTLELVGNETDKITFRMDLPR